MNHKADVLIVTITEVESRAVMKVFQAASGKEPQRESIGERIYHDLGEVNGARVFMALSGMAHTDPYQARTAMRHPVRYDDHASDEGKQTMVETTLQVRVPIPLLRLGLDQNEVQHRINEWLVLSLFTEGHISSGKAARLMNISRVEFLALLRARGIAYINYTPDELAEEFAAVKKDGLCGHQSHS